MAASKEYWVQIRVFSRAVIIVASYIDTLLKDHAVAVSSLTTTAMKDRVIHENFVRMNDSVTLRNQRSSSIIL
jgi:hypothetical protein